MQHFLLNYFKTLSVGPAEVELTISRIAARCSSNWATRHGRRVASEIWFVKREEWELATVRDLKADVLRVST